MELGRPLQGASVSDRWGPLHLARACRRRVSPESHRVVYAKGVGSQFIFVSPALDLVVTVTGGNHANDRLMAITELLARSLFGAG